MDVNNQDLSLSVYNHLCQVVGSEDVVRTRRGIFNADDFVLSEKKTHISCGSKAEGLDLCGSDFDYMIVFSSAVVYESIDEIHYRKQNRDKIFFIMDTSNTKPGYTRLKLYDGSNYRTFSDMVCREMGNETFFSSKLFREYVVEIGKNYETNLVIHGPCNSDPDTDMDFVTSFHCEKWILQANGWIHRSRSSWPDNTLIKSIVKSGVMFVPVGCKNSPQEDLEFRISFNVAEKILVHSFSHVQLLCYALLKLILNHFIKPQYGEILCSYFVKTIMFWVSEESVELIWRPRNFLRCFDQCFKRLVYCVTYSTCLHYFIPELDFFEDRFSKSEHDSLTSTLQSLYNNRWQCVLQTVVSSSFAIQRNSSGKLSALNVSALPCVLINECVLMSFIRSIFGALNLPGKQMYALTLSRASKQVAHGIQIDKTEHVSNKQRYRNYRKCLNHILLGLHHDAVSGWLLLASFFYTRKQYQQCLIVLNYCLHKCTPDKILLLPSIDTELQYEFNIEVKQHVKNGFLRACKRRVVGVVLFEKQSCIIPAELSVLNVEDIIFLNPIVFGLFLRSICLHRLNLHREKMNALCDLETTVRKIHLRPILYNDTCIAVARQLLAG